MFKIRFMEKIISLVQKEYFKIVPKPTFCFIFGSMAYHSSMNSDIDIALVSQLKLKGEECKKLEKSYFLIHNILRRPPSDDFPGEKFTIKELRNAELGKGFFFDFECNKITIESIISNDQWNNFNSHRLYLSAIAGPSLFIYGNREMYEFHKQQALLTLVKVILCYLQKNIFTISELAEDIIGGEKNFLGFVRSHYIKVYLINNLTKLSSKFFLSLPNQFYKLKDPHSCFKLINNIKRFNLQNNQTKFT